MTKSEVSLPHLTRGPTTRFSPRTIHPSDWAPLTNDHVATGRKTTAQNDSKDERNTKLVLYYTWTSGLPLCCVDGLAHSSELFSERYYQSDKAEPFDDVSFWLLIESPSALTIVTTFGLGGVAFSYFTILVEIVRARPIFLSLGSRVDSFTKINGFTKKIEETLDNALQNTMLANSPFLQLRLLLR
ncbi:unnamed protein product [Phytophthora lilii]|uniref:Unnamed protein product n=1 Tax=Phytophthora lilii TaxID=2077276 RepID=A0A9W6TN25_9STRA|nr:unnamed protein product [Phytophthora lilii]